MTVETPDHQSMQRVDQGETFLPGDLALCGGRPCQSDREALGWLALPVLRSLIQAPHALRRVYRLPLSALVLI